MMDRRNPLLRLKESMLAEFRRAWIERRPYQSFAWIVGTALMVSGLVHLGVFFVDGGSWKGPVSWRKPVTFGLSFGITTVTLAWITGFFPYRRLLVLATVTVAVTSALEVFFVTLQKWRGVPSHFNDSTPFDGALF